MRSILKTVCATLLLFVAREAAASKYTGPKEALVEARVTRRLGSAGEVPQTDAQRWDVAADAELVWVEARPVAVVAYDDNGWGMPRFVPDPLYVAVPVAAAVRGRVLAVHLAYRAAYGAEKLAIVGSQITPRFERVVQHAEVDPWVARIEALPVVRGTGPGPPGADRTRLEAAHRAYRIDEFSPRDGAEPPRCKSGEHVVRLDTITIVHAGRAMREMKLSGRELHEIAFHGARFTPGQLAALHALLD